MWKWTTGWKWNREVKTTDALRHNDGISADCNGSLLGTGSDDNGLGFVWLSDKPLSAISMSNIKPLNSCSTLSTKCVTAYTRQAYECRRQQEMVLIKYSDIFYSMQWLQSGNPAIVNRRTYNTWHMRSRVGGFFDVQTRYIFHKSLMRFLDKYELLDVF